MHYLISILVSCAILVIYALILIIIDQFIGQYGDCKITINKDKEFIVTGGNNLLTSLTDKKVFLPSACGGKGTCGFCKCIIKSGGGEVLPTEKSLLTKEDLAQNKRLSCQVKVKNDLALEIPADLLEAQEYPVKVTNIENLTYDIKLIEFNLLEKQKINFKPGQYIQFKIPGTDEFRAYSIASTPKENNFIQLMVRLVK
ncbi:MAG: 2Fe-2S iron-sulfur cluster binding domain-containing protein, partial [Candidatus Margulisbacteria bacterium]|nr:2Fe-2S iron-sulfur cluster binding domain-containing protein [Candidatus Margulisiibacteriota bacterium]